MIGLYSANSQAITAPPFSFGNALEFDGVDDNVTFSSISFGSTWTFSTWFKYNAFATMLISDGVTNFIRVLSATSVNLRLSAHYNFAIPAISTGTWYHLMVSVNSSSARCYINGVESTTGAQTVTSSGSFSILGSRTSDLFLNGVMDEVAIWVGTAGTLTDAQDFYNGGDGALASDVIASPTAYWRMNGSGTDTIAIDEQGTYNGTLNNFPASGMWVAH